MKRVIVIVALIALTVVDSALTFRFFRGRHALHADSQPAAVRSSQTSQIPAQQQPAHPAGVIIVGNGSHLTVIRPVSVEQSDYSYLHIYLNGSGEMLFRDAESKLVGYDGKTGKLLNDIANSSYDEGDQIDDHDDDTPAGAPSPSPTPEPTAPSGLADSGFRRIEVGQPAPGTYLLTVITDPRSGNSKYSLEITFTSRSEKITSAAFTDVAAPAHVAHTYKLQIPSDPLGEIKAELVSPGNQR